jgi:hypothetical protein
MGTLNDPYSISTDQRSTTIQSAPKVVDTKVLTDPFAEPIVTEPVEDKGFFRGIGSGLVDLVTGGDRPGQDLPEIAAADLELSPEQNINIAAGMIFNMNPKARRDVIEQNLPGVVFDENNNIAEYEGKKFVVNKPGFSTQDALDISANMAQFIGAGNIARLFSGAKARVGAAITGAAGTQVTLDKISEMFGSKQGVDLLNAAVVGTMGGTFQALGPIAQKMFTQKGIFSSDGSVSKAGKKVLTKMGVDPETVTREYLNFIDKKFREAARSFRFDRGVAGYQSLREAKRVKQAATEGQFGIKTTLGQKTDDLWQLSREEHMRKGGFGPTVMEEMQKFDAAQTEEIIDAANRMVAKLGQRDPGKGASFQLQQDAADEIFNGIQEAARLSDEAIQAAYALAGPRAKQATLDGPGFRNFAMAVRRGLSQRTKSTELTPATIRVLKRIGEFQKRQGPKGSPYRRLTLKNIEEFRRELGAEIDDAIAKGSKTDAGNIIVIKRTLDQWLDEAFDNALFSGDQNALNLMQKARGLRRAHAERFERQGTGDDAGRAIEKLLNQDTTNIETMDYLLGRVKLGETGAVIRTADRLKKMFGKDSEEWNALRSAAAHRMIYGNSTRTTEQVSKGLGGGAIYNRMTESLDGRGREFSDILFTVAERRELRELAKAIKKTVPERTFGPSGTADHLSTLVQEAFNNIKGVALVGGIATGNVPAMAISAGLMGTRAFRQSGVVRKAIDESLALPRPRVVPLWSATGATTGAEAYELQRTMAEGQQ